MLQTALPALLDGRKPALWLDRNTVVVVCVLMFFVYSVGPSWIKLWHKTFGRSTHCWGPKALACSLEYYSKRGPVHECGACGPKEVAHATANGGLECGKSRVEIARLPIDCGLATSLSPSLIFRREPRVHLNGMGPEWQKQKLDTEIAIAFAVHFRFLLARQHAFFCCPSWPHTIYGRTFHVTPNNTHTFAAIRINLVAAPVERENIEMLAT